MAEKSPVLEKTYRDYLKRVAALDLSGKPDMLGIRLTHEGISIPFFGRDYLVSSRGVAGPDGEEPIHAVSVVLCQYLLLAPPSLPEDEDDWVSYRDFRDAAPFAGAFANNTEKRIAGNFGDRPELLAEACEKLGGFPVETSVCCDLAMQVYALPRVPVLLVFHAADEEFGPECSVLFEKRAGHFLDMECLAIVGWMFSEYLARLTGSGGQALI